MHPTKNEGFQAGPKSRCRHRRRRVFRRRPLAEKMRYDPRKVDIGVGCKRTCELYVEHKKKETGQTAKHREASNPGGSRREAEA